MQRNSYGPPSMFGHLCLDPDPPGSTPPAPPVPPAQPPAQEPEEEMKFTREALKNRLEREALKARTQQLKDMGFDSLESWQSWKKASDDLVAAKAEEERAKLSEIERYRQDIADRDKKVAEAEAARQAAEAKAEAARISAHRHRVFASKGIVGTDYALFKLENALNALKDGEELDENAYLDQLLADPRERFALGVADAGNGKPLPVTTTAPQGGPPPKPPVPGAQKHVSQMTKEEWEAYKKEHHLQ